MAAGRGFFSRRLQRRPGRRVPKDMVQAHAADTHRTGSGGALAEGVSRRRCRGIAKIFGDDRWASSARRRLTSLRSRLARSRVSTACRARVARESTRRASSASESRESCWKIAAAA